MLSCGLLGSHDDCLTRCPCTSCTLLFGVPVGISCPPGAGAFPTPPCCPFHDRIWSVSASLCACCIPHGCGALLQLSEPATKYPSLSWGFLETFPYLLPSLIGVGFQLLSLWILVRYMTVRTRVLGASGVPGKGLPTHRSTSSYKSVSSMSTVVSEEGDGLLGASAPGSSKAPKLFGKTLRQKPSAGAAPAAPKLAYSQIDTQDEVDVDAFNVDAEDEEEDVAVQLVSPARRRAAVPTDDSDEVQLLVTPSHPDSPDTSASVLDVTDTSLECGVVDKDDSPPALALAPDAQPQWNMFKDRNVIIALLAYCVLGLLFVMADELFPLFAKWPLAKGGLGFTSNDIGIAMTIGGIVYVPVPVPCCCCWWCS